MWIVRSAAVAALVAGVLVGVPAATAAADGVCPSLTPVPGADLLVAESRDRLACADLRGMDFTQADLRGADLHGSDLTDADLGQAELRDANLARARLAGADLGQADLTNADLRGADLTGADLAQADLRGADLRDADLTGATLYQAEMDDVDLRGSGLRDVTGLDVFGAAGVRFDSASLDGHAQVAHLLLWPAAAAVLLWWRRRIGHLVRHRTTTPVRPAEVLAVGVGIPLLVSGAYQLAVGVSRGFAQLAAMGWLWAVDPGPLAVAAAEPLHQLALGAGGFVAGGTALLLAGLRRTVGEPPAGSGQVAIGAPSLSAPFPEFSPPVRKAARVAALLGSADVVAVVALWLSDGLPASGPWQAGTALGHVVTVGVATLFLFQVAATTQPANQVTKLSGLVLSGSGRDPYVWLSGTSAKGRPAHQLLPWTALEHVHLIRVLGTTAPRSAMVTVRLPGAAKPTEFPKEIEVTPAQVAGLREALPADMITEHVRVPASN